MQIQSYNQSKYDLAEFLNSFYGGSKPDMSLGTDTSPIFVIDIASIPKDFNVEEFTRLMSTQPLMVMNGDGSVDGTFRNSITITSIENK